MPLLPQTPQTLLLFVVSQFLEEGWSEKRSRRTRTERPLGRSVGGPMGESNEEKGEPVGVPLAAVSLGGRDVGRLASRKPRPPAGRGPAGLEPA